MKSLFLAPHNDDETLFGAFTLLREKPLVAIVTDSWIQFNRGEEVTADQRWQETVQAMKTLDCPVVRLGVRDDIIDEWAVKEKLSRFTNFDVVYAPAIQGGNPNHDLISKVATEVFGGKCKHYTTYTPTELYTTGNQEIVPTPQELELKNRAMESYISQLKINGPHFDAVRGKSEWLMEFNKIG